MKTIKTMAILAILMHSFSCGKITSSTCDGKVSKEIILRFVDKTTGKPLNAANVNASIEVQGFSTITKSVNPDSSYVSFKDVQNNFSTEGRYLGTVKVDNIVVGKFVLNLRSEPSCNGFPEFGEVDITEGNLEAKSNSPQFEYGNKIGGPNSTNLVLKL
jgi:hypothetical protein